MKSPTQAIDSFWKDGFFKDKKKTTEVNAKLSSIGLNSGNVTDLLRKRKYLRNKKGFWIQKHPFEKNEDDIEVYYFEPSRPRTSRKDFVTILNSLKGEIKICNPYLNKDTLKASKTYLCKVNKRIS